MRRRPLDIAMALFASGVLGALGAPLHGCTDGEPQAEGGITEPPAPSWGACQASDQAFVRRAMLALNGRRPWGQAEVNAYEDIIAGARAADGTSIKTRSDSTQWADLEPARRLAALAMMRDGAFRARWGDFFMDALRVARVETKSQAQCYGDPQATPADDGSLAAYVRDNDASAASPPTPNFRMGQLLASAITLDDLSPVYRAHLFAMVARPLEAANVGALELERSRRQDFGAAFDASYIHRDLACLPCHNSESSVTWSADPAKNRAWPVPGRFEAALYGASTGAHPPEEANTKGTDDLRAWSMLRVVDVVDPAGASPFGWSGDACGRLKAPEGFDPLGVDAFFGSVRSTPDDPGRGLRASVWDLERALRRGVDRLSAHGLVRLPGGELADADEALAYLVAMNIVDQVWAEIMGARLTIANYFPRTEAQRDALLALTEHFIASHFSLKTLLLDIVAHPAFNLRSPDEGCGAEAYELPLLFDPWTSGEADASKRKNSPADAVFALSPRLLIGSLHRAMEWPPAPAFPSQKEAALQAALGIPLKDAAPGFRGLDFQGRLAWEAEYGACAPRGDADFITKLMERALSTPGATLGDAVIALKDRLLGEPWIDGDEERKAIEALAGAPLESKNPKEAGLRAVCGAFASTPQLMLGGIVPVDARDVPRLTPKEVSYLTICFELAARISELSLHDPRAAYAVDCEGAVATVKRLP